MLEQAGPLYSPQGVFRAMLDIHIRHHYPLVSGSELVAQAFNIVDRAAFVPDGISKEFVYCDRVITIEEGKSSMSRPSLIASMILYSGITERLLTDSPEVSIRVLEIGTASGYN